MSSHAYLTVSGYPILFFRSFIDPTAAGIFSESDQRRYMRRRSQENPLIYGTVADPADDDEQEAFEYRAPAWQLRHRLDAMGFTYEKAHATYDARAQLRADESLEEWPEDEQFFSYWSEPPTFEQWLEAVRFIIEHGVVRRNRDIRDAGTLPDHVKEMLEWEGPSESPFRFPGADYRWALRCILEVTGTDSPITLDYSELVHGGYVPPETELCATGRDERAHEFISYEPIVVLTEGATDAAILSASLRLLYPHMAEFYTFADFQSSNTEAGAAELVRLIKGLVSCQIKNRVLAIFDNDTAGTQALQGLRRTRIPDHIKTIVLPDIEIARNYPTVGPQGLVSMDVNGKACGIELYLSRSVLEGTDGALEPVHWKSYIDAQQTYQGSLLRKDAVRAKFMKLAKRLDAHPDEVSLHDWVAMRQVLESMFAAFQ